MAKVFVLPDYVASQIAAGEVVERPSSVVKELVENAIDAGATEIYVSASEGCRNIRVADNGGGMAAEDAVLAFQRHATSKLKSAEDLFSLTSLGFRGEALPSIAAVSRVTCYTRLKGAESGVRIEAAEGTIKATETGCAEGTVMEVADLFYNVPARLKFLKKGSTEFGHIVDVMQSLSICYPSVAIELRNDREVSLKTSGSGDLARTAVESRFFTGNENLIEVKGEDAQHSIKVRGFVAKPIHFRGDRKAILSMVNNRPVRCPLTYKALEYAYSDLIPRGRHPFALVAIELSSDQVDVNIHPTKKEIKYGKGNEVYQTVQRAVLAALRHDAVSRMEASLNESDAVPAQTASITAAQNASTGSPVTTAPPISVSTIATGYDTTFSERETSESTSFEPGAPHLRHSRLQGKTRENGEQLGFKNRLVYSREEGLDSTDVRESDHQPFAGYATRETAPHELPAGTAPHELPAGLRLLGYLKNTYILLESESGLEIVEQHIAHERTIYERLLAGQKEAGSEPGRVTEHSQNLIVSVPLNLTADQNAMLNESRKALYRLGFEFDIEESGSFVCTQVPLELAHKDYAGVIHELLDQLLLTDHANLELEATKSIACQSAIKNGMPLSEADIVKLLYDWWQTPRNDTCPHGRPVRLSFSMDKLFQLYHPA